MRSIASGCGGGLAADPAGAVAVAGAGFDLGATRCSFAAGCGAASSGVAAGGGGDAVDGCGVASGGDAVDGCDAVEGCGSAAAAGCGTGAIGGLGLAATGRFRAAPSLDGPRDANLQPTAEAPTSATAPPIHIHRGTRCARDGDA